MSASTEDDVEGAALCISSTAWSMSKHFESREGQGGHTWQRGAYKIEDLVSQRFLCSDPLHLGSVSQDCFSIQGRKFFVLFFF